MPCHSSCWIKKQYSVVFQRSYYYFKSIIKVLNVVVFSLSDSFLLTLPVSGYQLNLACALNSLYWLENFVPPALKNSLCKNCFQFILFCAEMYHTLGLSQVSSQTALRKIRRGCPKTATHLDKLASQENNALRRSSQDWHEVLFFTSTSNNPTTSRAGRRQIFLEPWSSQSSYFSICYVVWPLLLIRFFTLYFWR